MRFEAKSTIWNKIFNLNHNFHSIWSEYKGICILNTLRSTCICIWNTSAYNVFVFEKIEVFVFQIHSKVFDLMSDVFTLWVTYSVTYHHSVIQRLKMQWLWVKYFTANWSRVGKFVNTPFQYESIRLSSAKGGSQAIISTCH